MIDQERQGLTLPAIGLGTMRQTGQHCVELVEAALAEGYRHLDTARKYGNEESVGLGMRRSSVPRDEVVLTTKLDYLELEPVHVRNAVEDSLRRLGVDYIDLLLVHWPNPSVPLEDTLAEMQELRDTGSVRFLGVANFPSRLLAGATRLAEVVTNQVEYHPFLDQSRVLSACRTHGLALTAYCPLGRGNDVLANPVVKDIAGSVGRSTAQVVLRWLVQQDSVVAIPGTSDVDHLRENLAVHDFELDEEQMRAIHGLSRGERIVNPPHAPEWDG